MARYRMPDGTIVDTTKARRQWPERITGQQVTQTLARSKKGRYYIETRSDELIGFHSHVEWVSPEEACRWLLLQHHDNEMPEDLQEYVDNLVE